MADQTLLRAVADRGAAQPDRNQLQRFDWLLKALEIFVEEGIDAVRVTRLADELTVTRGSFYWHFSNRDDLIDALVDYWRDKNTSSLIDAFEGAASLSDGIFRFFETCLDPTVFDPRLDLAIREWSRRSEKIRTEMDAADNARIESITEFFKRFDYPMPDAFIRARVLYYAQIGFYALDVKESLKTRLSYTEAYYESFTGKTLDPKIATANKQQILEKFGDKLP